MGTLAYLTADTTDIVNTFTVGNITIDLDEHVYIEDGKVDEDGNDIGNALDKTAKPVKENKNYKMVPGLTMPKDPFVTVEVGSEPCWIFVKITENEAYDDYLEPYQIGDDWVKVEVEGYGEKVSIYKYKKPVDVLNADKDAELFVLGGEEYETGEVKVQEGISKEDLQNVKGDNIPTLTFMAYAIQSDNLPDDITDAAIWALIEEEEA